jgi:hypothetical protein
MAKTTLRALVDRIEDGMAVLLLGEDESVTIALPCAWLPAGVHEGVVLRCDVAIDQAATDEAKRQVHTLLKELPDEP